MSWIAWLHKPCQEKSIRNIQEMHLLRDQDVSFCPPAPLFFFKKAVGFFSLFTGLHSAQHFTFSSPGFCAWVSSESPITVFVLHRHLLLLLLPCVLTLKHAQYTHFFFFSLKFHLPGFIFHDTLSVCITLIQHPHRSLRTLCCQTPYL